MSNDITTQRNDALATLRDLLDTQSKDGNALRSALRQTLSVANEGTTERDAFITDSEQTFWRSVHALCEATGTERKDAIATLGDGVTAYGNKQAWSRKVICATGSHLLGVEYSDALSWYAYTESRKAFQGFVALSEQAATLGVEATVSSDMVTERCEALKTQAIAARKDANAKRKAQREQSQTVTGRVLSAIITLGTLSDEDYRSVSDALEPFRYDITTLRHHAKRATERIESLTQGHEENTLTERALLAAERHDDDAATDSDDATTEGDAA